MSGWDTYKGDYRTGVGESLQSLKRLPNNERATFTSE